MMSASGGLSNTAIRTTAASGPLVAGIDGIVVFNGAALTATLPDPTGPIPAGWLFTVKNVNAGNLTVNSAGAAKTIDGAASQVLAQWAKITVFTDGTQWLSKS